MTSGVTVHGRALARNGAVTLDTDTFHAPDCDTTTTTAAPDDTTTTAAPDDTTTTTAAPDDTTTTTERRTTTTTTQAGTVGGDRSPRPRPRHPSRPRPRPAPSARTRSPRRRNAAASSVSTLAPTTSVARADALTLQNRLVTVPAVAAPTAVVTAPVPTLPKTGAEVTNTLLLAGLSLLLGGVALAFGKMADGR